VFFIVNNIICAYLLSYTVHKLFPNGCLWKVFHINFHFVVVVSQIYTLENFNSILY
jgi:hypothetical protein